MMHSVPLCVIYDALCIINDAQLHSASLCDHNVDSPLYRGRLQSRKYAACNMVWKIFLVIYYMNDAQWCTVCYCVSFMTHCASSITHSCTVRHCVTIMLAVLIIEDACSQENAVCTIRMFPVPCAVRVKGLWWLVILASQPYFIEILHRPSFLGSFARISFSLGPNDIRVNQK